MYDENKESEKLQRDLYNLKEENFENILADDEINGIVISTPAKSHHAIAKKCIQARKHVFIEKPICLNVEDARFKIYFRESKCKNYGWTFVEL